MHRCVLCSSAKRNEKNVRLLLQMLARTPQVIPIFECRGIFIYFMGCPHYQAFLPRTSYRLVHALNGHQWFSLFPGERLSAPEHDSTCTRCKFPLEVPIFLQGLQKQQQVTLFLNQLPQISTYPSQYTFLVTKYHS